MMEILKKLGIILVAIVLVEFVNLTMLYSLTDEVPPLVGYIHLMLLFTAIYFSFVIFEEMSAEAGVLFGVGIVFSIGFVLLRIEHTVLPTVYDYVRNLPGPIVVLQVLLCFAASSSLKRLFFHSENQEQRA